MPGFKSLWLNFKASLRPPNPHRQEARREIPNLSPPIVATEDKSQARKHQMAESGATGDNRQEYSESPDLRSFIIKASQWSPKHFS